MTAIAAAAPAQLRRVARAVRRLESVRPAYVVGLFVVVQWLATLALALSIRHNGWLYYHGGDQVWFWTTSWLVGQGHLPPTSVGFGWSVLLFPLTYVLGPNLVNALPVIIVINVAFLMPIAIVALYGVASRLGGRLFGYWTLLLWVTLPFIGIKYTNTGFKARYTERSLPDSFGLTALSDFPHMVLLLVAAYLVVRVLQRFDWTDGILAGLLAGFAIGTKPSGSLFLAGVVLAFVVLRRWHAAAAFAIGFAPCLLALLVWKWRGLGYVPLFQADGIRVAAGAVIQPIGATLGLGKYFNVDWYFLNKNLESLQEHFWSARVVEWTLLAGTFALLRLSRVALLVFGAGFWSLLLVKGSSELGRLESGSLLHMLVPVIPAFVLLVAALPLLLPRVPRHLPEVPPPAPWGTPRLRLTAISAAVILFAVVPIALAGSSTRTDHFAYTSSGPIPVTGDLGLTVQRSFKNALLSWKPQRPAGTDDVFYVVLRSPGSTCSGRPFMVACSTTVATTRDTSYIDEVKTPGFYSYTVLFGANWIDDPIAGDEYLASRPVMVDLR